MAFIFREPLVFIEDTGLTISPNNTELFGNVSPNQVTIFSIGQAVATDSDVKFNKITISDTFIIDDSSLVLNDSKISGSITLVGSLTTTSTLNGSEDLIVLGTLTAEKIETQLTQSVTLFESGSTIFGDTSDDTHQFSGSILISGSLNLSNNHSTTEISNDTLLADNNSAALITENAVKNYLDNAIEDEQVYLRKSFTHTGSFVNSNTSSFTAVTASAPSTLTTTTEDDFIFFLNGQMMEHDALTIQQSGSFLKLHINSDSIGYDLEASDEIIGFGKFNS